MFRFLFPRVFQTHETEKSGEAVERWKSDDTILFFEIILGSHVQIDRWCFHDCTHSSSASADAGISVLYPVDCIAPVCRLLQAADQADKCCLARAVLSDESVDRALWNVDRKIVKRLEISVAFTQ